jgi:asparagine synthase (glutamine-hydrolysing)
MCRISGIIDNTSSQIQDDILLMRDAMRHGGPDGEGVYHDELHNLALGHRRLSLIDLTDAGSQPMKDRSGNIVLVFNGEIYNYLELKKELIALGAIFYTKSDTEVIIQAYLHWGNRCYSRFKGMFALALYDQRSKELILARDHAGIKPLYYYADGDKLYFASEIRAFTSLQNRWEENLKWKIYFLTYGYLPEPITTLKNVFSLEKGSYKVFNVKNLQSKQQFFYKENFTETINDLAGAKEIIKTTLTKAVERHLIADAPIGLFLSGGIDSSLLTILAKKYKPKNLFTLSLDFNEKKFSENFYQQLVVDKCQTIHNSFILNEQTFINDFPDILKAMDQPSADGINSYFICKYARQYGLKAVLSGIGADELLGGYGSFKLADSVAMVKYVPGFAFNFANYSLQDKYKKITFLSSKDPVNEYLFYRGFYSMKETATILGADRKEVYETLSTINVPDFVSNLSNGNKVSYLESNLYMLGQLLKDTDIMSMWHSVEVRVPFLDYDFINAVHSISSSLKYGHKQSKYLLIESFKDVLPREIWDRKKQGFTLPFINWMKDKEIQQMLNQPNMKMRDKFVAGKLAWSRYWAYSITNKFAVTV